MSRFATILFHLLGLLVAWALKWFYSRAGADELGWILGPTCRLAGLLPGMSFEREAGAGWIDHAHRMVVGPGCSGMNFLIIAFLTIYWPAVRRAPGAAWAGVALAASVGVAWCVTVATNATRIFLSAHLFTMDIYGALLTPSRLHRAAGALVCCLSLILVRLAGRRVLARPGPGAPCGEPGLLAPLGWYLGFAIGLPLAGGAWRDDAGRFLEHALFVVAACLLAALIVAGARKVGRTPAGRPGATRMVGWAARRIAAEEP